MPLTWGDYEVLPLRPEQAYKDASKATARRWHEELMAAKEGRKQGLFDLLARNGVKLSRSRDTDADLERVGDWFYASVAGDPDAPTLGEALRGHSERFGFDLLQPQENPNAPSRLEPAWYSVALDMHLWKGDILVGREPLWTWCVPPVTKRWISYNRSELCLFELDKPSKMFDEVDFAEAAVATALAKLSGIASPTGAAWREGMSYLVDQVRFLPMTKEERYAEAKAWLDKVYPDPPTAG